MPAPSFFGPSLGAFLGVVGPPPPEPGGIVAAALARGVLTYGSAYGTAYAAAYGGFFVPAAPAVLPTTLDAALGVVAATLAAAGVVPPAAAFVSLEAEPDPATAGPQAVVVPGAFAARGPHQDGMGRSLATEDGEFTVHVADQSGRDQAGRDTARLLGAPAAPGAVNLLAVAHKVKDLLNAQFVEDAAGNLLSVEPMFYRAQSTPRRYGADRFEGWAGVDLTFSLSFVAAMTDTATAEMGGP